MQVEIFTLCDAATVCSGKLNIPGTFDRLSFAKFPNESGAFAIATKVRCEPEEIGRGMNVNAAKMKVKAIRDFMLKSYREME
ncbi:MAG: DUF6941 family protein [Verrucomicrobiales bacterium]